MDSIPLFSGEISLYNDVDEGLRIECSERHAKALKSCLGSAGFTCDQHQTKISGTSRIHNRVEFSVSDGDFQSMKQAVSACLNAAGVTVAEEWFSSLDEEHVRLNLTNISTFDK